MSVNRKVPIILAGCLGVPVALFLIGMVVAVIAGGLREATMTDEQRAERSATQKAAQLQADADQEQAVIAAEQRALESQAAEAKVNADRHASMLALIDADPVASEIIESVRVATDVCEVKVKNLWHLKVKQIRLQDAQALHSMWTSILPPGEIAVLSIVDLNGNKVGGTGFTGIWVND